jgi:hypothetical protein
MYPEALTNLLKEYLGSAGRKLKIEKSINNFKNKL